MSPVQNVKDVPGLYQGSVAPLGLVGGVKIILGFRARRRFSNGLGHSTPSYDSVVPAGLFADLRVSLIQIRCVGPGYGTPSFDSVVPSGLFADLRVSLIQIHCAGPGDGTPTFDCSVPAGLFGDLRVSFILIRCVGPGHGRPS